MADFIRTLYPQNPVGSSAGSPSYVLGETSLSAIISGDAELPTSSAIVVFSKVAAAPDSTLAQLHNGVTWVRSDTQALRATWSIDLNSISTPVSETGLDFVVGILPKSLASPLYSDILGATHITFKVSTDSLTTYKDYGVFTPTNVSISQKIDSIDVKISIPPASTGSDFKGFNVYASLVSGGPYLKINTSPINTGAVSETINQGLPFTETFTNGDISTSITTTRKALWDTYSVGIDSSYLEALSYTGIAANSSVRAEEGVRVYVVVTAAIQRSITGSSYALIESKPSYEVHGNFSSPYKQSRELPFRGNTEIMASMAFTLLGNANYPNLALGSEYRSILDPVAVELSTLYTIQDFFFATGSWDLLNSYDDENGDGVSDVIYEAPLNKKSALKKALGFTNTETQTYIDEWFEAKARDVGIYRLPQQSSTGTVTISMPFVPETGYNVEQGTLFRAPYTTTGLSTDIYFRAVLNAAIPYADRSLFFNSSRALYEVDVQVTCVQAGTVGNLPPNTLVNLGANSISNAIITNRSSMTGGTDAELNSNLSARAKLAEIGKDSGTIPGYKLAAQSTHGVQESVVIDADNPLMLRDIDPLTAKHQGGMVDIYLKGSRPMVVVEDFALVSSTGLNTISSEKFYVADDEEFLLRTVNQRATVSTPIHAVESVYNATRKEYYDLANVSAGEGDGDLIRLDKQLNKGIGIGPSDLILVTYTLRVNPEYTLTAGPLSLLTSVVLEGSTSPLPSDRYSLQYLDDPMYLGGSSKSRVSIKFDSSYLQSINAYNSQTGYSEVVAKVGTAVPLNKKGIDLASIEVFVKYQDPAAQLEASFDPAIIDIDFSLDYDPITQVAKVIAEPNGKIQSGNTILVTYKYSPNFKATYLIDDVVLEAQNRIASTKHACANVLVKSAVRGSIECALSVVRMPGESPLVLADTIKREISSYVNSLKIGEPLLIDSLVSQIKALQGVYRVFYPTLLRRKDSSVIPYERVGKAVNFRVYQDNSKDGILAYVTRSAVLNSIPYYTGAPKGQFKAVYEDGIPLKVVESPEEVASARGQAFINGDGKIIVSTRDGLPPQLKAYNVTYFTYSPPENGSADDILPSPLEYLSLDISDISIDASAEAGIKVRN